MRALFILLATASIATAADQDYCTAYARGSVVASIAGQSSATYPKIDELRTHAYLRCLNAEEGIDEADSVWMADLVNGLGGTMPAADKAAPVKPPLPQTVLKKLTSHSPAEVCTRAHRKVVFSGKSWRCQ